jgi:hypothetical protein
VRSRTHPGLPALSAARARSVTEADLLRMCRAYHALYLRETAGADEAEALDALVDESYRAAGVLLDGLETSAAEEGGRSGLPLACVAWRSCAVRRSLTD